MYVTTLCYQIKGLAYRRVLADVVVSVDDVVRNLLGTARHRHHSRACVSKKNDNDNFWTVPTIVRDHAQLPPVDVCGTRRNGKLQLQCSVPFTVECFIWPVHSVAC